MTTCVLVDASQLSGQSAFSGIGTYVRELLGHLGTREDLSVAAMVTDDAATPAGVGRRPIDRRFREGRRAVWEHEVRRAWEIRGRDGAIFHNPNPHAPLLSGGPWIQTLHDLIPLVFDDPALMALRKRFRRFGPRYRGAAAVVAVSRHAADEAIRLLGLDAGRVEVIPHGVGPEFVPAPSGPAQPPYLSVVAEYSRRKGFDAAFEVVGALADDGYPHRLVLAGRVQEWLRAEFEQLLSSARRPDRIECRGFVADLPAVYQGATVHLVTSRYEGFGLPALEAMACGVPVVAFANSSIPEVVGDAGLLVPDGDVAAMVAAVKRVLDDPVLRSELTEAGRERAGRFSWAASAQRHAELYAAVAGGRP